MGFLIELIYYLTSANNLKNNICDGQMVLLHMALTWKYMNDILRWGYDIYIFLLFILYKGKWDICMGGKNCWGGGIKKVEVRVLNCSTHKHTNTKVTSANAGLSSQMNVGTNSTGIHGLLLLLLLLSPTDYTIQNKIMFTLMLELL